MSEPDRDRITVEGIPLNRARDLAVQAATVAAAAHAGVFRGLLDGPADPGELAGRLGLERRAVSILLPVLAELDLLERDGEAYRLTAVARRRLADPDSDAYQGGGLPHWLETLRHYTRLPMALRHGGPVGGEDASKAGADAEETAEEERLARFMAAMAAAPDERVQRLADLCMERLRMPDDGRAPRLLDLGGGPGHMSRAFVERGFRATLFDRPDTVDLVGRAYGLNEEERIDLVGGDFVEDALPTGPFDLVLLSNVVHIYGPETNRRLVEKVAGVTRPDGLVAVADFFRGRSPRAAGFALLMLLRTEEGNTYSVERVTRWLEGAGFRDRRVADLDPERQLLTARHAGA